MKKPSGSFLLVPSINDIALSLLSVFRENVIFRTLVNYDRNVIDFVHHKNDEGRTAARQYCHTAEHSPYNSLS